MVAQDQGDGRPQPALCHGTRDVRRRCHQRQLRAGQVHRSKDPGLHAKDQSQRGPRAQRTGRKRRSDAGDCYSCRRQSNFARSRLRTWFRGATHEQGGGGAKIPGECGQALVAGTHGCHPRRLVGARSDGRSIRAARPALDAGVNRQALLRTHKVTAGDVMTCLRIALAGLALVTAMGADGAEIKVFWSGSLKSAFSQLAPEYQKSSGNTATIEYGPAGAIAGRVDKGEAADVVIVSRSQLQKLESNGKVVPGSF